MSKMHKLNEDDAEIHLRGQVQEKISHKIGNSFI